MKNYMLFCGSQYYPSGGFHDFIASYDTIEEAKAEANKQAWADGTPSLSWAHVVFTPTGLIVAEATDGEWEDRWTIKC